MYLQTERVGMLDKAWYTVTKKMADSLFWMESIELPTLFDFIRKKRMIIRFEMERMNIYDNNIYPMRERELTLKKIEPTNKAIKIDSDNLTHTTERRIH